MRRGIGVVAAVSLCTWTTAQSGLAPLEPGRALERDVGAGERHTYFMELAGPGRWGVHLDQQGIDVALVAWPAPDGPALEVDGPLARRGPEWLVLPAGATGLWTLEVRAPDRGVGPGRYRLSLDPLPADTPKARARLSGEEAFTRVGQATRLATPESRRQALAACDEARGAWRLAGARREEALALDARAALHVLLGEWREADAGYAESLALWREMGDVAREAAALNEQGVARWSLGQVLPARELLEQALALRERLGDAHALAETLANLGLTYHAAGDLDQALARYTRAMATARDHGEQRVAAALLNNLGGVHLLRGEPDPAREHFERALALNAELGDRKGQAEVLNNLALLFRGLGEPQAALQHYSAALAIARELSDGRAEARTLSNMAFAYQVLGEPERARTFYEQALPLRRAAGDGAGEAATLNTLAQALLELGQAAPAADLARQALQAMRATSSRIGEGSALVTLARADAAAGRTAAALAGLETALALAKDVGSRALEADVTQRRGEILAELDQPQKARELLTAAVELRRALRQREGEASALHALARVERRLGLTADALGRVRAALALLEDLRSRVVTPELRATFFGARRPAYELHVDLLMDLHRRDPGAGHDREALLASEAARARTLVDLLAGSGHEPPARAEPALAERRDALLRRLSAKASRRLELAARNPTDARVSALDREVNAARAELDEVEAALWRSDPRYAALVRPPRLDFQDVQALLDDDSLLLEYALGETRSLLWLVTRQGLETFELEGRATIEAAVRAAYEALSVRDVGAGRDAAALAELSRLLLGPVATRLGTRRLVIVPDGALHYVPFAALPDPAAPGPRRPPLVEAHEIVSLPSVAALSALRGSSEGRATPTHTLAVLADAVFDADDPRLHGGARDAARAETRSGPAEGEPGETTVLGRLQATRLEAETIAALVPPSQARVVLGFDATRSALVDGTLASARILHLATHGVFDARNPELSGLVLSRFRADGQPRDGFLRLHDIYGLRLASDLVVLSGCQTALGREVRGEGLVGLTRGFMYAGVPRVAASLWRVPDRATAELMARFYEGLLRDGLPPAAALRRAQLALRAERRWSDPYYWAAFLLQGDWR